jgi:hypothetical protein
VWLSIAQRAARNLLSRVSNLLETYTRDHTVPELTARLLDHRPRETSLVSSSSHRAIRGHPMAEGSVGSGENPCRTDVDHALYSVIPMFQPVVDSRLQYELTIPPIGRSRDQKGSNREDSNYREERKGDQRVSTRDLPLRNRARWP